MAKRRKLSARMSAEQAHQALTFLIHEGKLGVRTVERALAHREKLIREVRERLGALGMDGAAILGRLAKDGPFPMLAKVRREASRGISGPRMKRRVSAAVKKTRQAQGRYMAAVRGLSKSSRKQVKAIREKSGVNAAIAAAKRLVG